MVLVGLTGLFGATDSDADDQYFTEDGIRYLVTEASGLKVSVAPPESGKYETTSVFEIPAKVTHDGKEYSVTGIANGAFANTQKLNAVSLPEGLVSIGDEAFNRSSIYQDLTIPSTVETIGESAFASATITGLDLSLCKVKVLPDQVFSSCTFMKYIILGSSIEEIGQRAFQGDSKVSSVDMSKATNLKTIGSSAFQQTGSSSNFEMSIPASVTSIDEDSFSGAKVSKYTVDGSNANYKSVDGVLLTKDGTVLLFYPLANGISEVTVPSGVTRLGENAFYYGSSITTITMDNSVQIGGYSLTMTGIKTLRLTQSAELPSGYEGIIKKYFTTDGNWGISNINIKHLIIDSTYAMDLSGLMGAKEKYVDFTEQSKATVGGKFTKDGSDVPSANRAGLRFTSIATDTASDTFAFDNSRFITVTCDPEEGGKVDNAQKAEIGSSVTLTATADSGFKFGWWGDDKSKTDPTYTFTMPASDVDLVAHWIMIENTYYTVPASAVFQMTKYLGGAPENKNPSSYNYYNFQNVDPVSKTDNNDGTTTYVYILVDGKYGAIAKGDGYVTYKDLFDKKKNTEVNMTITEAMLKPEGKTSTTVDRNIKNDPGDDFAGILVSGTKSNHIFLANGQEMSMMVYRQWQEVSNTTTNPFLEPEIVYTITDLSGNTVSDVISITDGPAGDTTWRIKGLKEGTVVVTVWMKAMTFHNLKYEKFMSATWPELTEVFVVTVGSDKTFDTGMTMYDEDLKVDRAIDSDFDYFYYDWNDPGYSFTFTPASGTTVTVYNPILGTNGITGFKQGTATQSGNDWTVLLTEGRNVVKMENNGVVNYQVLMGMPVKIIVNGVDSSAAVLNPGQANTVAFMSPHGNYGGIFYTKGKLAGIYNAGTTIWYDDEAGERAPTAKQPAWGMYFFMSKSEYQTVSVTVPEDWDLTKKYTLHPKGIVITGIDGNGDHRTWFLKSAGALGIQRSSFLPEISIRVAGSVAECEVSDDGGQTWKEYNSFKLALDACKDGSIIKVNNDVTPGTITKNIEIRMNGHGFKESSDSFRINADVKLFGINPQNELTIFFGDNAKLTTDSSMNATIVFENPQSFLEKVFLTGPHASAVAIGNSGFAAIEVEGGVALFRTTDLPFGVYRDVQETGKKEFFFYQTLEKAVGELHTGDTIYILNYQPQYAGGVAKNSYDGVNAKISTNLTLKTVVRVSDGTHSSFYVDGKEFYNNGKQVPLPSIADLSTSIDGELSIDGGHTLTIGNVAVLNDIMLGGGKGTAASVAQIKLGKDVPQFRLAVGFDKLSEWAIKTETPEGTVYSLDPECKYTFVTSEAVSLNDRVGVNASGFKANIAPGGKSATLEASSSMIAYVQTGEQSFTGYSSLEDAIKAAGSGTVYILYRTTNVPGDADTTTHIIDHDMTWGTGYKFATVHQMVSEDGSTSQFIIDSKCATLIMSDGHLMDISVDADFTKIYVEGKVKLRGQAVIDLGEDPVSALGSASNGTTVIDVTDHNPGLIVRNLGSAPVTVELPSESGSVKYYTYMVGNDLYFGTFSVQVMITASGQITVYGPDGMNLTLVSDDQTLTGKISGGQYVFTGLLYTNYKLTMNIEGETITQNVFAVIIYDADHKLSVPLGTSALMMGGGKEQIQSGPVPYSIYYDSDGKITLTMPDGTVAKLKAPMHSFNEVTHDGKVYDHCDCGYEVYLRDASGSSDSLMPILIAIGVAIVVGIAVFVFILYRRGMAFN